MVVVNYTTKSSDADLVAAEINASPGGDQRSSSHYRKWTKSDRGSGQRFRAKPGESLFDAAEKAFESPVHILVNSAGVLDPKYPSIANTSVEDFDRTFSVNTKGAFLCSKEAANRIKQGGGGRIILLTSSMTRGLKPGFGAYAASKAAVETMVKILAKELKGTGITANCVAPGPIATEMFYEGKSSEVVEKIAAENPFGRVGEVKDVVPLVGFLACDGGEWINGQIIPVNAVCRCAVRLLASTWHLHRQVPFASSVTEAITGLLSSAAKLVSTICAIFHASASWQASCRVRKRT
ncbi:hypothetical protein HID58_068491 [Brassica napus]|uniref:3-oxoacyl-[acyl-carrier-protein] reductase n=1 Tax=Brassica napus TaxID=3708 RepID=A0ABQ7ZLK6_BRANA|nr:hypothetical protein HID58_068491 [Brassica napus]